MKKSIGLTANISEFRPNLPQTKHLNYFMGTNPVYMAGGGDVKAGIPNYPDVNVTRGFLPAALGFAPGGDAGQKKSWFDAIITVIADMVGGEETDEKVISTAKRIIDHHPEKAKQIIKQGIEQGKVDPGLAKALEDKEDTELPTEIIPEVNNESVIDEPLVPSDRQPPLDTITPIDTAKQRIAPKADEVWPPQKGGITQIPQEIFDKEEEIKGLETLRKEKKKDGFDWGDFLEELLPEGILPDKEEVIPEGLPSSHPDFPGKTTTPYDVAKERISKQPELGHWLQDKSIGKFDSVKPIGESEQNLLKKGTDIFAKSNQEQMEIANTRGITAIDPSTPDPDKKKKDVPAWALPLMSAGFAMMASKSPYFMQALGEGGQKGLETFTAQETGKEEKLDKESERKLREAQTKYYLGEGRQPTSKTVVRGGIIGQIKNGVWEPITDSTTNKPLQKTIGRQEAIEILSKNVQFQMAMENNDTDTVEKMIRMYMDVYNNTDTFVSDKMQVDEGGSFDLGAAINEFFS